MSTTRILSWVNPKKKIWGFHVHQELPEQDFRKALVIQHEAKICFTKRGITIDAEDAMKPGYGPHLAYMWELRIESAKENVFEQLGYAITWMAINRCNLSAYIHPLMHDFSLPEIASLAVEGRDNQANTIWFGYQVPQKQDFFFHPPLDEFNRVIDTRSARIIPLHERDQLLKLGRNELNDKSFKLPENVITNGFHIHMDYSVEDNDASLDVYKHFMQYLENEKLIPTSTRIYKPRENGPHIHGGWEVKFETNDSNIYKKMGVATAWLMCNRQGIPVFIHPVTWQNGDHAEELKAHKEYAFFLDKLPELDLTFFSKHIPRQSLGVVGSGVELNVGKKF